MAKSSCTPGHRASKNSDLDAIGLASIRSKDKGLGLGADDYLTKPFYKYELISRIRAIL